MKFASIAVVASLNLILHESSVYGWSSWGESESDHKPTRRPTKLPSSNTWSWANPWDSSGSGGNVPTNWVWNGWDSWTGDGWNGGKHTSPPTVKLTGSPVTTSPSERKVTNTPSELPSTMPVVTLLEIPQNPDDFGEPDWVKIIEIAFPTWDVPEDAPSAIGISEDINRCPRLTEISGDLDPDFSQTFLSPKASAGLWNPCYYTKAAAGLNPSLGGYPTPIDTRYPYEFAAPYKKQPGDGSTHHCPADASNDIDIGRCPKIEIGCGPGSRVNCVEMSVGTDFSPIGHIPPYVPLAAVKNAYNSGDHDVCSEWFDGNSGCNIKIDKLDELVIEYFGVGNQIKFQPPVLFDGVPSSTYYKLEYGGEQPACTDGRCFGPHYCTKEVSFEGGIWEDFCPYVHTGENSGLYRHPHLALAALELWIANQCMPGKCPSKWLNSPAGEGYATNVKNTTGIVWIEMDDNMNPMAQPALPYTWPNAGGKNSIFPGIGDLYGNADSKKGESPFVYYGEVPK